jgi:hyperosmotically inducible protein
MKPSRLQLAVVVAAGLAAGVAQAQGTADRFRALDTNKDGFVTRVEVAHIDGYARAFGEADDDKDGRLSSDEFIKSESIHARSKAGAYISDSALTARVKAALLMESDLKSADVSVETSKGEVLLSGLVKDDSQRKKAYSAASRVEGVKSVKDKMVVR